MTTKKIKSLSWHEAMLEILACAGIRKARLARQVGVDRSILQRQLDRSRPVSLPVAEKLNHAVALLVGDASIEGYLTAIFVAEENREDDLLTNRALLGVAQAFKGVAHYFVPDALHRVLAFFDEDEWTLEQKLSLGHALNVANKRRLIRGRDGKVETRTRFAEMLAICSAHGLELTPLLRSSDEIELLRSKDELLFVVRQALRNCGDSIEVRSDWEDRIARSVGVFERAIRAETELKLSRRAMRGVKRAKQEGSL